MKFDSFANELHRLISRVSDRDTAGEIRNVRSDGGLTLFENDDVFHALPQSFFNPACFQMLPSVPIGTSMLNLPATVTVPGFDG